MLAADALAQRQEAADRRRRAALERLAARRRDEQHARSFIDAFRKAARLPLGGGGKGSGGDGGEDGGGGDGAGGSGGAMVRDGRMDGPNAAFQDTQDRFAERRRLSREARGLAEEIKKAQKKGTTFGFGERWKEGEQQGPAPEEARGGSGGRRACALRSAFSHARCGLS